MKSCAEKTRGCANSLGDTSTKIPLQELSPPHLKSKLDEIVRQATASAPDETQAKTAKPNQRNSRKKSYDRKVKHTLGECPCCGGPLKKKKRILTCHIIHLQFPKVENVLHERETYWCGNCKKTVAPQIEDSLPNSKFSLDLSLFIVMLYTAFDQSHRKIGKLLDIFDVSICPASVNNAILRVTEYLGEKKYRELEEELKRSQVTYADETGHRHKGKTNWLWLVTNARTVFHRIESSRSYKVAKKLPLGKITVADGYRAYDKAAKSMQRCWAHLLRKARNPEHPFRDEWEIEQYKEFVEGLAMIFKDAKYTKERSEEVKEMFNRKLREFITKPRKEERNLIALQNYILEYEGEWFTFVGRKGIEPTNNRAERALRPMVIKRKISQHTWSDGGRDALAIFKSLADTCRLRNENFMDLLRNEISGNLYEKGKS